MAGATVGFMPLLGRRSVAVVQQHRSLVVGSSPYIIALLGYGLNGKYKIAGTVKVSGVPYAAKLYLYPCSSRTVCIGSVGTDANGAFVFNNIAAGKYQVEAVDPTEFYDTLIYDFVVGVSM